MESGDFFERVPSGGDCYVIKGILSQLDDDEAVRVLSNVLEAMKESTCFTLTLLVPSNFRLNAYPRQKDKS